MMTRIRREAEDADFGVNYSNRQFFVCLPGGTYSERTIGFVVRKEAANVWSS
jgi:hypothetical protein